MTKTISSKIIGYKVVTPEEETLEQQVIESMHEGVARLEVLHGSTYKIKPSDSEHALYITINDHVLNAGTEFESKFPYEVFINSKNMEHFQWVVALTRLISAVFRKGGDVCFLVSELEAVFDPKGGYWKKGKFIPSLVADIGSVIRGHMITLGLIKHEEMSEHVKEILAAKREEYDNSESKVKNAKLCVKCGTVSVVRMDNCETCLTCAASSCG